VQTPKYSMEAEKPSGIETLPCWHLTAYESYITSFDQQSRWISSSHYRRNSSCSSAELPAVIVASTLKHPLFCPMKLVEVSLVSLRRPLIGERAGGEISPQLSHHGRSLLLGGGETEALDHWLGRFSAQPYGGLIFPRVSMVRDTRTGLP
jgi:hypothetical protein